MLVTNERPRGVAARSPVSAAGGGRELAGGVCHLAGWLGLTQSLLWNWEGEPFFSLLAQPHKASQSFLPLGNEGGSSSSPASWLGRPESTRSLARELRLRLPQQSPSNARPFPGRARMQRVLGWGDPGIGCRRRARPCPARGPRPPSRSAGLRAPHPRGLAHPAASLEEESRGYAPRGTEFESSQATDGGGGLDPSQGLCTHITGAPRVKSAFGVNLTL